jgi:4-hydroxybenzoate polyprenyltransferase
LAWFVQLNVGYALASWPCFPRDQRLAEPVVPWSKTAMVVVLGLAVVVAVAAFLTASHAYERSKDEVQGNQTHLLESGAGRTRFLALWGMIFGAGFALATLVTGIAFIVLPRCAG